MKRIVQVLVMVLTLGAGGWAWAQSVDTELCLAADASRSIDSSEWDLQMEGYASAIEDPSVIPQDGSVTITIVRYANTATVVVGPITIHSQTAADVVANAITHHITQSGDGDATGIGNAIEACTSAFDFEAERVVIDISADGPNSIGIDPETAADDAILAGVDAVNLIAIEIPASDLEHIARPQPANNDATEDGFVVEAASFEDFVPAIEGKILAEITRGEASQTLPVSALSPAGLTVLLMVMFGLGLVVVRRL